MSLVLYDNFPRFSCLWNQR